MEPPDRARTLWVDVTLLWDKAGVMTGIPRTLTQILGHWRRDGSLSLRLFRWEGRFRPLTWPQLEERWASVRPPRPSLLQACWRRLPRNFRRMCRYYLMGTACAGRLVRSVGHHLWGRPKPYVPPLIIDPGPFAPGDVVLMAGASWEIPDVYASLAEARRRTGVAVALLLYDISPVR